MDSLYEEIKTTSIPEIEDYTFIPKDNFVKWLQTFGDSIKNSTISNTSRIHKRSLVCNSIIEEGVEIYEGCTVRNSYIGKNTVIGHCSEVANSIILSECMIPRFNYIGTSILGERVRLGGCVMFATRRHDDTDAKIITSANTIQTDRWKIGAIVGSDSIIGFGTHVNPGHIIGHNVVIGALIDISFNIPPKKIIKIRQKLDMFDNHYY